MRELATQAIGYDFLVQQLDSSTIADIFQKFAGEGNL
jgi:hypothetical protein